jgi:hypothetical protein
MYFVAAIVVSAMLALYQRRDAGSRRIIVGEGGLLLALAVGAFLVGWVVTPNAYRDAGINSEVMWHRSFIGLGANPDWPFGNLATTIDCRPEIPEGLRPQILDRNGQCAYTAAVKMGVSPGALYGAEYETALRHAFLRVLREYPRQVLETYLLYKPLLIWETLSTSTSIEVSRKSLPILFAVGVQIAILILMSRMRPRENSSLLTISAAFGLIAACSFVPQLLAWSSLATSPDLICYLYVGIALLLTGALRSLPVRRTAQA